MAQSVLADLRLRWTLGIALSDGYNALLLSRFGGRSAHESSVPVLSPEHPQRPVDKLCTELLCWRLATKKSSNGAVSSQVLLATMKAQQAVAIRFVGRRVSSLDVPFFYVRLGARRPHGRPLP